MEKKKRDEKFLSPLEMIGCYFNRADGITLAIGRSNFVIGRIGLKEEYDCLLWPIADVLIASGTNSGLYDALTTQIETWAIQTDREFVKTVQSGEITFSLHFHDLDFTVSEKTSFDNKQLARDLLDLITEVWETCHKE